MKIRENNIFSSTDSLNTLDTKPQNNSRAAKIILATFPREIFSESNFYRPKIDSIKNIEHAFQIPEKSIKKLIEHQAITLTKIIPSNQPIFLMDILEGGRLRTDQLEQHLANLTTQRHIIRQPLSAKSHYQPKEINIKNNQTKIIDTHKPNLTRAEKTDVIISPKTIANLNQYQPKIINLSETIATSGKTILAILDELQKLSANGTLNFTIKQVNLCLTASNCPPEKMENILRHPLIGHILPHFRLYLQIRSAKNKNILLDAFFKGSGLDSLGDYDPAREETDISLCQAYRYRTQSSLPHNGKPWIL